MTSKTLRTTQGLIVAHLIGFRAMFSLCLMSAALICCRLMIYAANFGGHCTSCPFKRGAAVAEMPLHNGIIGNVMVYQDRLETNLFQLFVHPEN